MSFWTPEGEHRVPSTEPDAPQAPASAPPAGPDPAGALDPEDRANAEALAAEMAEVRRQLLSVPAAVVIANHAMGLYELAAIHLGTERPNLAEAKVAIEAYGALVDAVGDQLGPDGATLRDALAQIRLAFVQVKAALEGEDAATPQEPTDS